MKHYIILLITLSLCLKMNAQDQNFHIYLCIGQSNMEGSATIETQDLQVNKRLKLLPSYDCLNLDRTKSEWTTATPPLCHCHSGLSPADYFGRTMLEKQADSITVGLIHMAIGGCDIRLFDKDIHMDYDSTYAEPWFVDKVKAYGCNPHARLIELAKKAQQDGVIKGIILHQGETNEGDTQWPQYVKKIYEDILAELSLEAKDVPLLAGQVVGDDQNGVCASMNPIINTLPTVIPTAHIISSEACPVRDDNVHFNSEGVRILGRRYAMKMIELQLIQN